MHDDDNFVSGKQHVIELGAGTGALSVGLARAGAASVTCTDLPCHLARIKSTINANRAIATTPNNRSSSIKRLCRMKSNDTSSGTNGNGSCGDGGGGDHGLKSASRASYAAEEVTVAALRWGEQEDLVKVRASRHEGRDSNDRGNGVSVASTTLFDDASATVSIDKAIVPERDLKTTVPPHCRINSGDTGAGTREWAGGLKAQAAFDMIVLSEVLYWPALDLLQEDTREPLRRTLVGLSNQGTVVVLVYKER